MGDITKNFSQVEFTCKCGCGSDHIKYELVSVLQRIRDTVNRPVIILSGVRCRTHNAKVGGAKASKHVLGEAADIRVNGYTPSQIAKIANGILGQRGGVKAYTSQNFTHVDVRPGYWRA